MLLWCNVGFAAPVSHYLELGYKLHSTNVLDDGSAIIYHLILDLGKKDMTLVKEEVQILNIELKLKDKEIGRLYQKLQH